MIGSLGKKYRKAGWSLIDQGVVSAANFLSILILAKAMSPANFGIFMLAHTGLLIMNSFQNAIITQPHNVLGVRREGQAYINFTTSLALVQLIGSTILSLVILVVGYFVSEFFSEANGTVIIGLAFAAVPWMMQEFVRRVLYTKSETTAAAINDSVSYGLQLIGVIALMLFSTKEGPSPIEALLVFGGSSLIAVLLGLWQLRRHFAFKQPSLWVSTKSAWLESWHFGKWLVSQQILVWFGTSGYGWLLAAIIGPEKFGMYRAAYQIVFVLNPIRQAMMNYLPSRISHIFASQGREAMVRWVGKMTLLLSIPFALFAALLIIGAEPILNLVYHDKFANTGMQWVVMGGAIAFLLNFYRAPKEYAIIAMGNLKALFMRTVFSTVMVLTTGILLIYFWEIPGALISEISVAIVGLIITQKIYNEQRGKEIVTANNSVTLEDSNVQVSLSSKSR